MTVPWPPDAIDLPVRLGPYTLREILGQGGMARVYGATLRGRFGFRTRVAIKVPLPRPGSRPQAVADELAREARLCGALDHQNLARVRDVGEHDGVPYVVMDRVAGPTVRSLIEGWGPLPPAIAVEIALQVCLGLEYAHEASHWSVIDDDGPSRPVRVVHRDLKPSNVMVDRNGVGKILDFGIARAIGAGRPRLGSTAGLGTPAYMSPEQFHGRPLGPTSDLFSVGLMLYEMAVGKRLIRAASVVALYGQLERLDHLVREEAVGRVLDRSCQGLGQLVTELVALDPRARPQSAADVGERLRGLEIAAGTRELARFVRGERRGWRGIRARHRAEVVATTVPAPVDLGAAGKRTATAR